MKAKITHLILAGLFGTTIASYAGTFNWDGGGADGNWSTADNWAGNTAPVEDDGWHTFVFDTSNQLNSNLDFDPGNNGFNTNDITFASGAGAFTLSGSSIDMLGAASSGAADGIADITNNSANTQTINNNLIHHTGFNTGLTFNNTNGGAIVVDGVISQLNNQADDVTIQGNGTVTFNGVNTYTQDTILSSGTLVVGDSSALGTGTLTLNGGTFTHTDGDNRTISNDIVISGTTTVLPSSNDLTLSGNISGAGTLITGSQSGAEYLTISDDLSGFTGKIIHNNTNQNYLLFSGGSNVNTTAALETTGSTGGRYVRIQNKNVTFGELSGTGGAILGNRTLTINQSTNTTYAGRMGNVQGSLSFTKNGTGTLTLTGANDYAGSTIVSGGTLKIGGAGKLQTGTTDFYSGDIAIASGATFQYSSSASGASAKYNGNITGAGTLIKDSNDGELRLFGSNTIANIEINQGILRGSNDANSFGNAGTTISLGDTSGTANAWLSYAGNLDATTKTGIIVRSGSTGTKTIRNINGTVTDNTAILLNDDVIIDDDSALTLGGVISGSGGLTKTGAGTTTFSGANTYSGGTTIKGASKLKIDNNDALGTGLVLLESLNSRLQLADGITLDNDITFGTAGNTKYLELVSGSATISSSSTITALEANGNSRFQVSNGGTLTLDAQITGGVGFGVSAGTGKVILTNAANDFTGQAFVFSGTLQVNDGAAVSNTSSILLRGSNVALNMADGVTIDRALTAQTNGVNKTLQVDNAGTTSATYSGDITIQETSLNAFDLRAGDNDTLTIDGVISGTTNTGITKEGAGTAILTGANTYSGATTISGGTLELASGSSHTGSGAYVINGGTLKIADGVDISGHAMTIGLGGVISPGNSPGTAITGNQTWNDGGAYLWEINDMAGTKGDDSGWDWLDIQGTLDINPTFDILITSLTNPGNVSGLADGFDYTGLSYLDPYASFIIASATSISGFDASAFNLDDSSFLNPKVGWSISLDEINNDIVLNAFFVPEPSSTALLGLGGLALMLRRKRS